MHLKHYTYEHFLVYSLSYFGLSNVVERRVQAQPSQDTNEILDVIRDCNGKDLSERAKTFRTLYRRFCRSSQNSRDKLINDMLSYCL